MFAPTALVVLALIAQNPPTPTPRPAGAAPRATTLEVRVTDRVGAPVAGAVVKAEGPVSRDGTADRDGAVTLKNVTAGTYRLRFERDGFFTFEKELAVKAGGTMTVDAALTPAPPPPKPDPTPTPAPPPPPPSTMPNLMPGEPKVVSIPDLATANMLGREATKETMIGCSGATTSRILQARDALTARTNADADEMLYIVAGEAAVKIGAKEQAVTGGWFALVPRGMEYSVTRKGRNPVIVLSVISGKPCAQNTSRGE